MGLETFGGHLTMLRVHDVGSGFGPPADQIDTEVVFSLDSHPDKAFGFTLRDDGDSTTHRGMLALLQSGFDRNWFVSTDADVSPGRKNAVSIRIWLTK